MTDRDFIDQTASHIVDATIKVHRALGPGLLESAYQSCLAHELRNRRMEVRCEVLLPVTFERATVDAGYRIDMVVNECVVVESKSVSVLLPTHIAQLLTYLRMGDYRLGFLINWNTILVKDGIKRVANNF